MVWRMDITAALIYSTPIDITINPTIREIALMPEAPKILLI